MPELNESDFDNLALQACETLGYVGGRVAAYDVAGYTRTERRETCPATVAYREIPGAAKASLPAHARFDDQPYLVRIGGFHRGSLYGPDQVGALFRKLGIAWNDGLGEGICESLLINRKYGLAHSLEAPAFHYSFPFLQEDWPGFREQYTKHLDRFETRLKELEPVYGAPLLKREAGVCVVYFFTTPLSLFVQAYQRNPARVTQDLQRWMGRPMPVAEPVGPNERLSMVKFWSLVRARHGQAAEYIAGQLRDRLGSGTALVGNFHELPIDDFESFGKALDHPAVAVRPLLLDDDLMLRHYTAYFTRLFRDLTGKPPMVSVRINLSAAGSRFVPGPNLIRHWTDQAVRHGAGAFYLWPRDYPMDQANPYDGMIPGNPEMNTHPQERWQAALQLHSELATRQKFAPPGPQTAILVPYHSALLYRQEWRRIYAAFSACAQAGIYAGFVGDWQAAGAGIPSHVRLLIVPVLEFVSPALRSALERFTRNGGTLLMAAQELYDTDGNALSPIQGAQAIPGNLFEVFPLDGNSSESLLNECAAFLGDQVKRNKVETHSWVYDVSLAGLPLASQTRLRTPDPEIQFDHWMYEHSSKWIYPYLK